MTRTTRALIAIGCLFATLPSANAQTAQLRPDDLNSAIGGWLVSPTIFREFVSSAPRRGSLKLKIECPPIALNRAVRGEIDVRPFMPEDWTYKSLVGQDHPRDCSKWFPKRAWDQTLNPGAKEVISLDYEIPRDASGCYWAMIQVKPRPVGSDRGATVIYEIPVIMTVRRAAKPEITLVSPELTAVPNAPGNFQAKMGMINDGSSFAVIGMLATLRDLTRNRVVTEQAIEDRNILPGTRRHLSVMLPSIPDGRYRLSVRADLGRRRIPAMETEYVIQRGVPQRATPEILAKQIPVVIDPAAKPFPETQAGGVRAQSIKVINQSNKPMSLDVATKPLEQSASGSIGVADTPIPPGLVVETRPNQLTLAPGQTGVVTIIARLDRAAKGEYWFGVEVKDRQDPNGLSELMVTQLPVKGTLSANMTLATTEIVKDSDGKPVVIKFTALNDGNQALKPQARCFVLDGVRRAAELEVPVKGDGGFLPGATIPNQVMLPPDLKPGTYNVEIIFQYGQELAKTLRVPVVIPEPKKPAPKPGGSAKTG